MKKKLITLPPPVDVLSDIPVEQWDLAKLRAHPKQELYFGELTYEEIKSFSEQIRRDKGIHTPLEILPNGTVVSGHRRLAAARKLGLETVPVKVRHDLAAQDEAAVEYRLIEANVDRRHVSKLDQARLAKAMYDIEVKQGRRKRGEGELREIIAKKFGMKRRTMSRHWDILALPPELYRAVDEGKIPAKKAVAIMKLTPEEYQPALAKLREGKNLSRMELYKLLSSLPKPAITTKQFQRALRDFLRIGSFLEAHVTEVESLVIDRQRELLVKCLKVAKRLQAKLDATDVKPHRKPKIKIKISA